MPLTSQWRERLCRPKSSPSPVCSLSALGFHDLTSRRRGSSWCGKGATLSWIGPWVGSHTLLQGIFLTQGWSPRLLRILYTESAGKPLVPSCCVVFASSCETRWLSLCLVVPQWTFRRVKFSVCLLYFATTVFWLRVSPAEIYGSLGLKLYSSSFMCDSLKDSREIHLEPLFYADIWMLFFLFLSLSCC